MILNEGGNIWPDETEDFDHAIIGDMMKQVNSVVSKTGAKALPIGSGATPTPGKRSGDLDMIVDAGTLLNFFKVKTPKEARVELEKMFQQAGFDTKKTGTSVHVKTKVGGSAQQVDIMVVDNGETAQKFHVHDIPKGSPYKGVHKQILIADLAKNAVTDEHPEGMKWSAYKGLLDRRDDSMISSDLDEIAKILLGKNAGAKDLGSVEAMVAASPRAKELVDALNANEDPKHPWNKSKVQPKESLADRQLNRIKELTARIQ
jgi:hypothetical protein